MGNKKISELPAATVPLSGAELMEIVQGGINKQVAKSDVATGGGGTVTSVAGTANRITSSGGATPVIDIAAAYDTAITNAINAKVTQTITNGVTTTAPSEDAVFDALAGKQASLGFTAENVTNKATNLTSPDNTKYPTTLAVSTESALKQTLINSAVAITDASSMALTAIKHTLTTSSSTRTFTITYTGDDITLEITLNAVTSVLTFPASALCVSDGTASGDNTCTLSGISGDKYILAVKKIGSAYYVVSKNFGQ